LSNKILSKIAGLNIKKKTSPTKSYLTASIGVAEAVPGRGSDESVIVAKADTMLYKAKKNGRDRIMW